MNGDSVLVCAVTLKPSIMRVVRAQWACVKRNVLSLGQSAPHTGT